MARAKPKTAGGEGGDGRPADPGWARLTWDDLNEWAGSASVQRGRAYQRGGRVRDLAITPGGELLALVLGTARYATSVRLGPEGAGPKLVAECSCPIGGCCKHAVAVVADYLQALADGRAVPAATDEDRRRLAEAAASDWDDEDEEDEDEDEETNPILVVPEGLRTPIPPPGRADWDAKIEREIRALSHSELADLAWSLVRQVPRVYAEFRERVALRDGDADRLLAETRREVRDATVPSDPDYDRWGGGGWSSPDYGKVLDRFERLIELGLADEVVGLGRSFFARALRQIELSHEGEGTEECGVVMGVVFRAVMQSSLSAPRRLLCAIEAELANDYDALGDATAQVFDAIDDPAAWSAVANHLRKRLDGAKVEAMSTYARDHLSQWIADALRAAGREGEVRALYESEARFTRSYVRLVDHLLTAKQVDDAEHWAREGIAATVQDGPGIAAELANRLRELARSRKQWDVVAAHAARPFFANPSAAGFEALIAAAKQAKVEEPVRAFALKFLETGVAPYRLAKPPTVAQKRPRAGSKVQPAPAPLPRVEADPAWPLPVPEDLIPLMANDARYDRGPTPHHDVLLHMALSANRPDEILRWFDALVAADRTSQASYGMGHLANRVAEAVAATHPERAIAVYRVGLDQQLPQASMSAYEAAVGYLKKLKPIYERLDRRGDWDDLVAGIREKYRNRPRFLELLDPLVGRTILDGAKPRKR